MMKLTLLVLLVVTQLMSGNVEAYGEDWAQGLPPWETRSYQVLLNALRIAPKQYIQQYAADYGHGITTIVLQNASSTNPLTLDLRLYYSAALIAGDVTTHQGCSTQSTVLCNGTSYANRINYFYGDCISSGGTALELISAGSFASWSDPRFTISAQLCANPSDTANCTADGNSQSVYRTVMTGSTYASGAAARAPFTNNSVGGFSYYWAIDLGAGCSAVPSGISAIYSGSHFTDADGNFVYMAIYNSASAPSSAIVVIDNSTTQALSQSLGTATLGAYTYKTSQYNGCHSYYFNFTVSGTTYRYPDTGLLWTYNIAYCNTSFTGAANPSTSGSSTGGSGAATSTGPNTGNGGSGTGDATSGTSSQTSSAASGSAASASASGSGSGSGSGAAGTTASTTSRTSGAEKTNVTLLCAIVFIAAFFLMI